MGSDAFFTGGAAKAMTGQGGGEPGAAPWPVARTYREGDFRYQIPAAPGRYTVTFTFVEPTYVKGERVFDVLINDKVVLSDFDIAGTSKGERATVVRSVPVEATDTGLTIAFKGKTGKAIVSSIDVAPLP
jgi:beta-galactosidase